MTYGNEIANNIIEFLCDENFKLDIWYNKTDTQQEQFKQILLDVVIDSVSRHMNRYRYN